MQSSLSGAIARIYGTDNSIKGAGFLVSRSFVVTCTHVIQEALGLRYEPLDMPSAQINIDFPLLSGTDIFSAKIVGWSPDWSQYGGDIAVLELNVNQIPLDLVPSPLSIVEDISGHSFHCFGFPQSSREPKEYDRGVWAQGEIKGRISGGWLQIQSSSDTNGYSLGPETIQRGYSGGPVWDDVVGGIIGMVVGAEAGRGAAFIIPIDVILGRFTDLLKPNPSIQIDLNREKEYLKSFIENTEIRSNGPYISLSAQVSMVNREREKSQQVIHLEYVEQAQSLYDRFLLTGVAGSGKSIALRYMAMAAAKEKLKDQLQSRLPVVISLADWQDDDPIDVFLRSRWPFSIDPAAVWNAYQIHLYLDGLDEMGENGSLKTEQLMKWMESPLAPSKIILASRTNNPLLKNFTLPLIDLIPLTSEQVNSFASHYLKNDRGHFGKESMQCITQILQKMFTLWLLSFGYHFF